MLADILALPFGRKSLLAHSVCVCIGMIPFLWFAKRKGVIVFDLLDFVTLSALVALDAVALQRIPIDFRHEYGAFLFPIPVLCFMLYRGIRNLRAPRSDTQTPGG